MWLDRCPAVGVTCLPVHPTPGGSSGLSWHRTSPMPAICLQSCPRPGHKSLSGKITWGLHMVLRGGGFSSPATARHTVYFHSPWLTVHLRNRNGAMASKAKEFCFNCICIQMGKINSNAIPSVPRAGSGYHGV